MLLDSSQSKLKSVKEEEEEEKDELSNQSVLKNKFKDTFLGRKFVLPIIYTLVWLKQTWKTQYCEVVL